MVGSYILTSSTNMEGDGALNRNNYKISIQKNWPYWVSWIIPLNKKYIIPDDDLVPLNWEDGNEYPKEKFYKLCRCGNSKNKPFCDGSHLIVWFDGTEVASTSANMYMEWAETITWSKLNLTDNTALCSSAEFCLRAKWVWELTRDSHNPESRKIAIEEVFNCPSGRLVVWDKDTGKPMEPDFTPEISVTEDPDKWVSWPLWAKGYISIESADGVEYEKRNRVTLCRCGNSRNKPFCDGSHIRVQFNDLDVWLAERVKIYKEKFKEKR